MKKLFTILVAVLLTASMFAQAPNKMSYQAVIRDTSNNLVKNQQIGMRVSILQGSATGTVVYKEIYNPNPKTNINGLITVEIGSGIVETGLFDTINWANGPYYIETETDPTGQTNYIVGTSQLLSVPYALYAANGGGTTYTAGTGISIAGNTITNTAPNQTVSIASGTGINVGGAYPSFTVSAIGNSGWSLTGNSGTIDGTNFIGTTDSVAFNFKVNNQKAGRIDAAGSTFLGYEAGYNNQNSNTGIGFEVLYSNTTGFSNTANGWKSLYSNTTGTANSAIGDGTLYSNTTGYNNIANGAYSLNSNTIGNTNIAIGTDALMSNTTASQNIAIGHDALQSQSYNNSGTAWNSDNIAIGYESLYSNQPTSSSNGYQNTAIGDYSLQANTTGQRNTATGGWALYSNTTGGFNTANGFGALNSNTTGSSNTAVGQWSLFDNTTGSDNTAIGLYAGYGTSGVSFTECTFIGDQSTCTQARTNVTMLGYGIYDGQCTGNNQVCIGNTSVTSIRAAVTGITSYSDARFKTNIKDNVAGLDFILKLKPVTYYVRPNELHKIWGTPDSLIKKMDFTETENEIRIGFVAQDVEKAAKECGFNFPGIDIPRNDKEVYTLRYVDFIMPMVKGMQEQQTIIETQNKKIEELQAQTKKIDELQKQIEALQVQLNKLQNTNK